jgi:hypothetical protein
MRALLFLFLRGKLSAAAFPRKAPTPAPVTANNQNSEML